jgi:hypothetical protein
MTLLRRLLLDVRRSRFAAAASAVVFGLLLSLAAPSVMSALGSLSAPVGCHSSVVGDHSDPCILTPGTDNDGGSHDDSSADGGGVAADDVVSATPTFTG